MKTSGISNKFVYVTFLSAVFFFTWSSQELFHLQIPTSDLLELRQQAETCAQETGVPVTHLRKLIDKTLPNDRPNKQFFQCVAYNTGFSDKDGHFILDKMLTLKNMNGTKDDVVKTITECNKISKEENIETVFATADCIHTTFIVTFQN